MAERKRDTRLYRTLKIGDKGQVVTPAEANKKLLIKPDDLFVMANRNRRGITMVKVDTVKELRKNHPGT
jgi:bifunctional DNA-binding transcriptional regulator/antitoxin component of YhaV-PrlF toxin-antitoxin module